MSKPDSTDFNSLASKTSQRTERQRRFEMFLAERPLLRVLFYEFWFRVAFGLAIVFFVFMALFLPKIWTVSPRGFNPVIKVSGLDALQSWSLSRSALKSMEAGDYDRAAYSWNAAIANYAADPDLFRGALSNVTESPRLMPEYMNSALSQCLYLLRLTETNRADLNLTVRVFEKYELHPHVLDLLRNQDLTGEPRLQTSRARALFHLGRMADFNERWQSLPEETRTRHELPLYRAAYLMGWGKPGSFQESKDLLDAAASDSGTSGLALKLQLIVYRHLQKPELFAEALDRLKQENRDTLLDNLQYWNLLMESGRASELPRLMNEYSRPPNSAWEAIAVARLRDQLKEPGKAKEVYQAALISFGHDYGLWWEYSRWLINADDWDEIRRIALQLKIHPTGSGILIGLGHYLEGRGFLRSSRFNSARESFEQLLQFPVDQPSMALQIADELIAFGFPGISQQILAFWTDELKGDARFQHIRFSAAYECRDAEEMYDAAKIAYDLAPHSPIYVNNYAAALLITRRQPDVAVQLTFQLMERYPNSVYSIINHSLSLLIGFRTEEAVRQLNRLNPEGLDPRESTFYAWAWLQVCLNRGQPDRARDWAEKIDSAMLFPDQVQWMDKQLLLAGAEAAR